MKKLIFSISLVASICCYSQQFINVNDSFVFMTPDAKAFLVEKDKTLSFTAFKAGDFQFKLYKDGFELPVNTNFTDRSSFSIIDSKPVKLRDEKIINGKVYSIQGKIIKFISFKIVDSEKEKMNILNVVKINGNWNILKNEKYPNVNLEIFSETGRLLFSKHNVNLSYNYLLPNLAYGVVLIKVTTNLGESFIEKKIIN